MMPDYAWWLVAGLLLVPSLVVGWMKLVARKETPAISGLGGCLYAFLTLAAALWIIHDRLG